LAWTPLTLVRTSDVGGAASSTDWAPLPLGEDPGIHVRPSAATERLENRPHWADQHGVPKRSGVALLRAALGLGAAGVTVHGSGVLTVPLRLVADSVTGETRPASTRTTGKAAAAVAKDASTRRAVTVQADGVARPRRSPATAASFARRHHESR